MKTLRPRPALLGLAIVALAFAPLAQAGEKTEPPTGKTVEAKTQPDQIRKVLGSDMPLLYSGNSIDDILNFLKDRTGVTFELDRQMMQMYGIEVFTIAPGVNIDLKIEKGKVGRGLQQFLSRHRLDYYVAGDRVVITLAHVALARSMRQPVEVDFQGVTVPEALKKLEQSSGATVFLDPSIPHDNAKRFSMQVGDVPFDEAVRLVAFMGGMKSVRVGKIIVVTSAEKAGLLPKETPLGGDPNFPNVEVQPGIAFPVFPGGGGIGGFGGIGNAPPPLLPPMADPAPAVPAPDRPVQAPAGAPTAPAPPRANPAPAQPAVRPGLLN